MARTAGQIALITAGTLATGALGYAIYFDYMRRNSPEFRRSLRKQAEKVQAEEKRRTEVLKARQKLALRAVLREIQSEEPPSSPEQQEAYFQEQVAMGERLATQGPEQHVTAASHFYRALRVYPQPVELLMIYQKVVPAPIFALVIELTQVPGISPMGGNPLAALGGMGGGAGMGAPAATASVQDVDDDLSPAPGAGAGAGAGGPGGRVPTDEEIAAIIAAATGGAVPAPSAGGANVEETEREEAEDEEEEEEGEGEGSQKADSAKSGASWEKVDEA